MKITHELSNQNGLMHVTLSNPPANLLGLQELTILKEIFESCGSLDSGVRAICIKSSLPKTFCLGLDPVELMPLSPGDRLARFQMLAHMSKAALYCGRPIVCEVNGPALAGGAVLAALADFRYFSEQDGKFCFSEAKVYLPVPQFVQALVKRTVKFTSIFETLALAKNYDARAALDVGFANELFANPEDGKAKTNELIAKITRIDPQVLQATLREGNKSLINTIDDFLKDPGGFRSFLTDEFFGKGLKIAIEALKPK